MRTGDIVRDVQEISRDRKPDNLSRRLLKILEELGETSEAYLSRTAPGNYKNKSWDDFREESIDTLIVLIDVALTQLPGSNYPPSALLANHLSDASGNRIIGHSDIETRFFTITKAVAAARQALLDDTPMTFYGAIGKGIRAAADMSYSILPGDDIEDIDEHVYAISRKKLDKWAARIALSTDNVASDLVEIIA